MNNAQPKTDFKAKQAEFSAYIRDPFNNPAPKDVKKQRIDTYRELFFNNVESFLSSNFPVLRQILSDQQWFELSQDFFSKHRSQSPYFSEIPEEFLEYLQHERNNPNDYPFLLELAHYEWVEMALSIAKEHIKPNDDQFIENIAEQTISLSPLAWPLAYQFPVEKISSDFLPMTTPQQPTYLLVYRDCDDEVHFVQINALTYVLLQLLEETPEIESLELIKELAQINNQHDSDVFIAGGLQILQDLALKGVIIKSKD